MCLTYANDSKTVARFRLFRAVKSAVECDGFNITSQIYDGIPSIIDLYCAPAGKPDMKLYFVTLFGKDTVPNPVEMASNIADAIGSLADACTTYPLYLKYIKFLKLDSYLQ